MSDWQDNWQEAFKEADSRQYQAIASALAGYRRALMAEGFTRRETMRLVQSYSDFIYDMTLNTAERDADKDIEWVDDDTVDPGEET